MTVKKTVSGCELMAKKKGGCIAQKRRRKPVKTKTNRAF
jgi:hypothetical protein